MKIEIDIDEKITNFKKMIYKAKADIIGLQENARYIDNDKDFGEYLFNPIYPKRYGENQCAIVSKYAASEFNNLRLSGSRWIYYATVNVNGKTLLMCSAHTISNYNNTGHDSAESISMRNTEYDEIFKWIHGEIQLGVAYNEDVKVSVPDWDYCVITMDGNTNTDEDKVNLSNYAAARGFTMANGGYLGWLRTVSLGSGTWGSIDNIIVSPNIVINSVEVYESMYKELYSDHLPMTADITLLG